MLRTAIFGLLLVAAFAAAAGAEPAQTLENWTSVTSENFSVIGNASADELRAASDRLEQFRWAFSRLYPQLKLDNGLPTSIVIFRDAASYFQFLPRRSDGTADIGVAGYYQAGEDRNYITLAIDRRQNDPFSTAVHEYVHSIIDANFDRSVMPPWLNEGLAEYFETVHIKNGRMLVVGTAQPEHVRSLRRLSLMPSREFLALGRADLKTMTPEMRRAFYAQSWATVHWLMQNNRLTIDGLAEGLSKFSNSGFEAAFKTGYAQLDDELQQSITGNSPGPVMEEASGQFIPVAHSVQILSAALSGAILGDLLFHTGEVSRSEIMLRASLLTESGSLMAHTSLGLLLAKQHRWTEARPFLENAVASRSSNHLVYFYLAFSLIKGSSKDEQIPEISDDAALKIRTLLKRSVELRPVFAEGYRLLALVDYIRDENLDEAAGLVQRGLSFQHDDAELKLLQARIFLRQEDIVQARKTAQQVTGTAADPRQKAEAVEIINAADEYVKARMTVVLPMQLTISLADKQSLVLLKRSWLTADEIRRIDEDRINNNLNRIVIRAAPGEQQTVGYIEQIACANDGTINYRVRAEKGTLDLTGRDFSSVRMTVAREGESTLQIGCGANLEKEMAVINYLPSVLPHARSAGSLTAISFVPEDFRLKSIREMSAARLVAVEDDTLKRSGGPTGVTAETIHNSILQYIRKPQKGEVRTNGTVQMIGCRDAKMIFEIAAQASNLRLTVNSPEKVHVGWFTVASSQLSLSCGSGPLLLNTLITYKPDAANGMDGELRSIEFVPEGFVP